MQNFYATIHTKTTETAWTDSQHISHCRAFDWQSRGDQFESGMLHQTKQA